MNPWEKYESQPVKKTASDRVEAKIKATATQVQVQQPDPVDFEASRMIENIPESAYKYGSDIWQAVSNPIDTATGLAQAAAGGVQKLIPGEAEPDALIPNYEPVADAIGQHFSDRYGSMDQFKTTMMEDPVGVVGDTAGLLGGIGMLPKAGKVGRLGAMMDPGNVAIGGGSQLLSNLPKMSGAPYSMYETASKIPVGFDRRPVINTALREGIMPTEGGLNKAESIVDGLSNQVDDLISKSGKTGEQIPIDSMLKPLQELAMEVSGSVGPNRQAKLAAIDNIVSGLQESAEATGKSTISVADAQVLKRELQGDINWGRKSQTADPFKMKADKAMAQGVREAIETAIPEIKDLNFKQKELLDVMDALQRPAKRIGGRDFMGIGAPMKVTAGASIGDVPGAAVGALQSLLDNPTIKSRLAITLKKIQDQDLSKANKRTMFIEAIRNEAIGASDPYSDNNASGGYEGQWSGGIPRNTP